MTNTELYSQGNIQKVSSSKNIEKKKKIHVILFVIKHQKVKNLLAEINNSDYKKLSKLSILGDLTLLVDGF